LPAGSRKVEIRQVLSDESGWGELARLDTLLRALGALDLELVVRRRTRGSANDIEAIF